MKEIVSVISSKSSYNTSGHGTHVAGTVASKTYGVAKAAKIKSVKVLDCDGLGTTSAILDGIDFIEDDHDDDDVAVVTMSFGTSSSSRFSNDAS